MGSPSFSRFLEVPIDANTAREDLIPTLGDIVDYYRRGHRIRSLARHYGTSERMLYWTVRIGFTDLCRGAGAAASG